MIPNLYPSPEYVRHSTLKAMALSPAHVKARIEEPRASTAPMVFGSLVHSVVFQTADFVVFRGPTRRGRQWDKFKEEHPGQNIVIEKEHIRAMRIRDKLFAHPIVSEWLKGDLEREFSWEDCGRKCAGRPDVVRPHFITELKTSTTAHPDYFPRRGAALFYHAQMAWYLDGLEFTDGRKRKGYCVAVEVAPPFAITPFEFADRALDVGRKQNRLWLEQWIGCEREGMWPDYVQSIVPFDIEESPGIIFDAAEESDPFMKLAGQMETVE